MLRGRLIYSVKGCLTGRCLFFPERELADAALEGWREIIYCFLGIAVEIVDFRIGGQIIPAAKPTRMGEIAAGFLKPVIVNHRTDQPVPHQPFGLRQAQF
jgi:hypothetical protein